MTLARGGGERCFQRREDDLLVDAFSFDTASTTIRISLFIALLLRSKAAEALSTNLRQKA
jgi:hypothetical protein